MSTPNLSTNSDIEPQVPVQPSVTTKTSVVTIITTAVIFTLVGATAMWGYQKMSPASSTASLEETVTLPITTAAITTTTPTPLADTSQVLQEYSSPTNPYMFSYPEDKNWQVFVTPGQMGDSVAVSCEGCTDSKSDMFQVTPVIFTTIEEYMQKDTLTTDKTAVILNGLPAVRGVQSGSEQSGGSSVVVFIVKDKKGYLLQQRYSGLYNKTAFTDFPQTETDILASFKFVE